MGRILVWIFLPLVQFAANATLPYKNQMARQIDGKAVRLKGLSKAMTGPTVFDAFELNSELKDHSIWITEYSMEVADNLGSKNLQRFLCHANIGMVKKSSRLDTSKIEFMGMNDKLEIWNFLTLSQGFTGASFPAGFGLKLKNRSDRLILAGGQFQNESEESLEKDLFFRFKIGYLRETDARSQKVRPLWLTRFVVKADLSEVDEAHPGHHMEHTEKKDSITKADFEKFKNVKRPGQTGHWLVPSGTHQYEKRIKRMRGPMRVHFVSLHVHPFADWVDLYDKTAGTVLWRGRVKTDPEGGFITSAEFYSSPQGFDLPKDHKIVTRVQYTNPYAHPIDAMATANVYLACDEKRHPKECAY